LYYEGANDYSATRLKSFARNTIAKVVCEPPSKKRRKTHVRSDHGRRTGHQILAAQQREKT
jgi:hypothetical protein